MHHQDITFRWQGTTPVRFRRFYLYESTTRAMEGELGTPRDGGESRVQVEIEGNWETELTPERAAIWVTPGCLPRITVTVDPLEGPAGLLEWPLIRAVAHKAIEQKIRIALAAELGSCGPEAPWQAIDLRGRMAVGVESQRRTPGAWVQPRIPDPGPIDVFWPVMDRDLKRQWRTGIDQLKVTVTGGGSIRLNEEDSQPGILVAATALERAGRSTPNDYAILEHEATLKVDPAGAALVAGPLLERMGFDPMVLPWICGQDGPVEMRIHSQVRSSAAHAWYDVPFRTSSQVVLAMRMVAQSIQAMLRVWLPAMRLDSAEKLRSPSMAVTLLNYSVLRTYRPMRLFDYTHDWLDTKELFKKQRQTGYKLQRKLRQVQAWLEKSACPQFARRYPPALATEVAADPSWFPRQYMGLLAAERQILLELGRTMRRMREMESESGRENPRELAKFGRQIPRSLRRHVRRLGKETGLLNLLLVDATAALAGQAQQPAPIESHLLLRNMEGQEVLVVNRDARRRNAQVRRESDQLADTLVA